MRNKWITMAVLGALGIIILGCSSIVTTSKFHGQHLTESEAETVAHIHSDIWGIYFLGFQSCPVITGSYKNPGSYHFFRDTVDTNTASEMVTEKSREMGATAVTDLDTDWDSSWQTVTLIFWLKEAQASGNAVIIPSEDESSKSPKR
jgi:uncharacterized protein YceK